MTWTSPAVPPIQRRSAIHGESGYERREGDSYFTEPWVTAALLSAYTIRGPIWEPAAGRGDMSKVMLDKGYVVISSDLSDHDPHVPCETGIDFLMAPRPDGVNAIVTNPPYSHAEQFIRRALLTSPSSGQVAMLLRNEYDCAAKRRPLFEGNGFAAKIVLTRRPRWSWWEPDNPKKASPRHNFAWFVWDNSHDKQPVMRWAP